MRDLAASAHLANNTDSGDDKARERCRHLVKKTSLWRPKSATSEYQSTRSEYQSKRSEYQSKRSEYQSKRDVFRHMANRCGNTLSLIHWQRWCASQNFYRLILTFSISINMWDQEMYSIQLNIHLNEFLIGNLVFATFRKSIRRKITYYKFSTNYS